jgi:TPR repeat protein
MDMARIETLTADAAPLGMSETEALYRLGMRHAADASTPVERIEAHKWFNIAAIKGNEKAARLRREIAEEMSRSEVAAAQRAAREWLTLH